MQSLMNGIANLVTFIGYPERRGQPSGMTGYDKLSQSHLYGRGVVLLAASTIALTTCFVSCPLVAVAAAVVAVYAALDLVRVAEKCVIIEDDDQLKLKDNDDESRKRNDQSRINAFQVSMRSDGVFSWTAKKISKYLGW